LQVTVRVCCSRMYASVIMCVRRIEELTTRLPCIALQTKGIQQYTVATHACTPSVGSAPPPPMPIDTSTSADSVAAVATLAYAAPASGAPGGAQQVLPTNISPARAVGIGAATTFRSRAALAVHNPPGLLCRPILPLTLLLPPARGCAHC
jgi:hypothetical protein